MHINCGIMHKLHRVLIKMLHISTSKQPLLVRISQLGIYVHIFLLMFSIIVNISATRRNLHECHIEQITESFTEYQNIQLCFHPIDLFSLHAEI